jgi:malonyl-CoA O-methyltransferase
VGEGALDGGRKHRLNILPGMASSPDLRSARRPLDPVALARVRARMDRSETTPWLHAEVARRMADRLPVIRLQPEQVVDWGAHLGASRALLEQAYPRATVTAVEADPARRAATARAIQPAWWSPRRWAAGPVPVCVDTDLVPGCAQLLWSNMGLHGVMDPQQVMQQWHRVLRTDGFLMFSTLGPGTLEGLRELYRQCGWGVPHAPFVDMHDLGDMLVAAGFADPVMDQEQITLTWPSAPALLAELRQLGGNVDPRRFAGLRTPRWRQRLCDALGPHTDNDGRPGLNFEVVYGHAFRPAPTWRLDAETRVPLDELRATIRAGKPAPR